MERGRGEEESFGISHIGERRRVEDQALPLRTRHHLCRQEVEPANSQMQHRRAQHPTPARRCGTEGRTRHQGREGRNGDGNSSEPEGRDGGQKRERERVEGRESLETYDVDIEVGRKTRERGRRQQVTSNHSRKTRRPSMAVASC